MDCYEGHSRELDAAWEAVETGLAELPEPLAGLARQWLAHISRAHGGGPLAHRRYFRMAVAPPLIFMPLWYAESHALPGEVVDQVLQATIWGYFAIRLQDDVLDEQDPVRAYALLGNICFQRMHRALAAATDDRSSFRQAFDAAWLAFSNETLAEHLQVGCDAPYEADAFEQHAHKVAFARVPLLALADRAGHLGPEAPIDHGEAITRLVHTLGLAYGRTNDIGGWRRDLRNGHRTWLLARAGWTRDQGAVEGAVSTRLIEGGLIDAELQAAASLIEAAGLIAETLGMEGFGAFVEERLEALDQARTDLRLSRLQRALAGTPTPRSP